MRDSLSKSNKEIENKIEALLFVSPTSISVNQLATLMNLKIKIVELAIKNLEIYTFINLLIIFELQIYNSYSDHLCQQF